MAILAFLTWPLARLADLLVWSKVRLAFGGRQKWIVSGGAALPYFLEDFYEVIDAFFKF